MNISQKETIQMNFNNLYYNTQCGDMYLITKYFIKQQDYTELIKHIIKITNNSVQIKENVYNEKTFNIYIDLKDTKLKNFDQDFLKQLIKFLDENYPDRVKKIYFQNASIMFKSVWLVIRSFIGKDTRKKIVFEKKIKELKSLNSYNNIKVIEITEDNLDDLF